MPNGSGISKQTFIDSDEATKWALTYDLLHEIYNSIQTSQTCQQTQRTECEQRFKAIESKWAKLAGALIVIAGAPSLIMLFMKLVEGGA